MGFMNDQALLLPPKKKKSEANQDYGTCSFTGRLFGRWRYNSAAQAPN